jgi:hypothetical protein
MRGGAGSALWHCERPVALGASTLGAPGSRRPGRQTSVCRSIPHAHGLKEHGTHPILVGLDAFDHAGRRHGQARLAAGFSPQRHDFFRLCRQVGNIIGSADASAILK